MNAPLINNYGLATIQTRKKTLFTNLHTDRANQSNSIAIKPMIDGEIFVGLFRVIVLGFRMGCDQSLGGEINNMCDATNAPHLIVIRLPSCLFYPFCKANHHGVVVCCIVASDPSNLNCELSPAVWSLNKHTYLMCNLYPCNNFIKCSTQATSVMCTVHTKKSEQGRLLNPLTRCCFVDPRPSSGKITVSVARLPRITG